MLPTRSLRTWNGRTRGRSNALAKARDRPDLRSLGSERGTALGMNRQVRHEHETSASQAGRESVRMHKVASVNSTGTGRRVMTRDRQERSRRRIAFGWYGGKFSHLDFILPHIPGDATHFCDVYGGSAEPSAVSGRDLQRHRLRTGQFFPYAPRAGTGSHEGDRSHPVFARGAGSRLSACKEPFGPRTGATVLCSRTANPHRIGADEQRGTLGPLRSDVAGRHGWRGFPMAWFRRRAVGDRSTASAGADRECAGT